MASEEGKSFSSLKIKHQQMLVINCNVNLIRFRRIIRSYMFK